MSDGPDDPGVLMATMKRVGRVLKEQRIPFALSGSFAAYARGAPPSHPAHDVDFVLLPDDVRAAVRALTDAGMRRVSTDEDWLVKVGDGTTEVDLIHRPSGVPITRDVLRRAAPLKVDSIVLPVVDGTDLIVMLLRSFCEHECDFSGPLVTARALREQVDWRRVRAEAGDSPYARAFERLLCELNVIDPVKEAGMPEPRPHYTIGHLREALAEDPRTSELGIRVWVSDHRVHLAGEVTCPEHRRTILAVARELMPGYEVRDELTVARLDSDVGEERLP